MMNRQESCPATTVGSVWQPSSKKTKSSTDLLLSGSKGTLDDEKKRKNKMLLQKILNRQESCLTLLGPGGPQQSVGLLQNILNRQESCLTLLGPGGPQQSVGSSRMPSCKKKNSSTNLLLSETNGTLDDEKSQESCLTMLGSGGSSCVSSSSAVSRMSAASAVNRGEMKSIIESMRRDREGDISDRERCEKNPEETLPQFEEQRKALLVKWQAMSEERKLSQQSSRAA